MLGATLGAGIGYVLGGVTGRGLGGRVAAVPSRFAEVANGPQLFAGAFGLVIGLIVGVLIGLPAIVFLHPTVGWPLAGLVVVVCGAIGARLFSDRASDLLAVAGLRPKGNLLSRPMGTGEYLIDSSAAIDGRILDMARGGVVQGQAWVAQFVLDELQSLADAADPTRRRRGRRGLDVLDALRSTSGIEVTVAEESVPELEDVDAKLVALADRAGAVLITTDHNLAKAAELRGIRVLNPHSLAEALRSPVSAGDQFEIEVIKAGSEPGQGIGYLDDGTMVVVAEGADRVGDRFDIEITGVTRTAIGRMLFAKPVQ